MKANRNYNLNRPIDKYTERFEKELKNLTIRFSMDIGTTQSFNRFDDLVEQFDD